MKFSLRQMQSYIFITFAALSIVIFAISFNDLLIGNSSLLKAGITFTSLGTWNYWIFTVSMLSLLIFLYMFMKVLSDTRKFNRIVSGSSKQTFIKNVRELETLAHRLGPVFSQRLKEAKDRWNYKS